MRQVSAGGEGPGRACPALPACPCSVCCCGSAFAVPLLPLPLRSVPQLSPPPQPQVVLAVPDRHPVCHDQQGCDKCPRDADACEACVWHGHYFLNATSSRCERCSELQCGESRRGVGKGLLPLAWHVSTWSTAQHSMHG